MIKRLVTLTGSGKYVMTETVIGSGSAAERIKIALRRGPAVRQKMSGPALRTFFAIGKAWNLSVDDRRGLLGWPSISTFDKYEAGVRL